MKAYFRCLALLWGLGMYPAIAPGPAMAQAKPPLSATAKAIQFGQQEVDQSRFVAIAQPLGTSSHKLLILEQVSKRRPCWSEFGSYPTQIEPLLVTFNFTGICGRSIDSNGFSIRVAGNDLALQYSLRLTRRFNSIVLQGTPFSTGGQPAMDIATTAGFTSGFLKLQLSPGWRFTKRTFNGRPLPHVYLTNDSYDSAIMPR